MATKRKQAKAPRAISLKVARLFDRMPAETLGKHFHKWEGIVNLVEDFGDPHGESHESWTLARCENLLAMLSMLRPDVVHSLCCAVEQLLMTCELSGEHTPELVIVPQARNCEKLYEYDGEYPEAWIASHLGLLGWNVKHRVATSISTFLVGKRLNEREQAEAGEEDGDSGYDGWLEPSSPKR